MEWNINFTGLAVVQCCFTSTETVRLVRDGEPRTATSTFTQILSSAMESSLLLKCCFTPTETVRLIRDGEPRTASSIFTQLLNSVASLKLPRRLHVASWEGGFEGGGGGLIMVSFLAYDSLFAQWGEERKPAFH